MKLFLDTSNDDFVVALFDNKFDRLNSYIIKNQPKKVPLIPQYIKKISIENNIKINDINDFYINLGPGFFTGVRISLVFVRTIALMTNANVHTISSMQILAKQNPSKKSFSINAAGGKVYKYFTNDNIFSIENIKIEQLENQEIDFINYENLIENFQDFSSLFTMQKDLMNIEPYYIKNPQIGVKK